MEKELCQLQWNMFATSLLISSRDKFRKEESFQKQTDSNNRLIFEKCTTRVLSNCRYCEYCRSMNHTKYNCQLIKPCTNCGIKGHKTTSCKKATSVPTTILQRPGSQQYFPAFFSFFI